MSGKRVIIGAGLAGLGAGLGLLCRGESDFVILERQNRVGGLASSITVGAWTFDRTGHFLHFSDNYVHSFLSSILELERITRRAAVAFRGRFVPYPFQQNLWALEPEEALDMVMGAIDAYYHPIPVKTFKDWILASVGRTIGEAFMLPYNRKLYGVDLDCLAPEQGGAYIPKPNIKEIVRGALIPTSEGLGYNANFFYPKSGGIQAVANALASLIADRILLNREVVSIDVTHCQVWCRSGESFRYVPPLISTIPLPTLATLIETKAKSNALLKEVRRLVQFCKATRILCVDIGIKGQVNVPYHWIYVPDEHLPFYRVGFFSNVSPSCCPDGCSSLWAEINLGNDPIKPIEHISGLIDKTLEGIVSLGFLPADANIEIVYIDDIWPGYVLFQLGDKKKIEEIDKLLRRIEIMSIGRYGRWAYMSMEESIKDGLEAVGCSSRDILALLKYLGRSGEASD